MINLEPTTLETRKPGRPWAFWMIFFFQYAAIAVYYTYLNVYFRNAGLSGTQIGLINMSTALVGVGSAVAWGYISDRTGRPRLLIAFGALGALTVAQFIARVHTFPNFLILGVLGSLLNSAPGTLTDSTTLAWLGEHREDYARYRLGGTFGYILTGTLAGFLFDRAGLQFMFPAYGVIMAVFAAFALFLPDLPVRQEARTGGAIGAMIRRPAWILFIFCAFLVWIASNASITFMGVVLDSMGANRGLIGIAVTIGAVVEIPFMMFSPQLLRRFGPVVLMIVALGLLFVRYLLLSWMPAPEWAIPINVLNGPGFVLFWNSAVTMANKMAPVGMAGTAQGLLSSTMGLAGVISALLTGILFDRLGTSGLFLVMAFFVLSALILFTTGNLSALKKQAV